MLFSSQVSTRFAKNLLRVFQTEQPTQFGSTASVVSAFTEVSGFPFTLTLRLLSRGVTADLISFLFIVQPESASSVSEVLSKLFQSS